MKTVKDYLDLGLVFVSGDKICGVTGDSSSHELDIFGGKLCEKQSSDGAVKIGVDCYARARWTPSSFAWRNNDGVKPEYKGLIEVRLNNTIELGGIYSDRSLWSLGYLNSVSKWRPVVLIEDVGSRIETILWDSSLDYLLPKKVTFKADRLNIDCREHPIPSRAPTALPNEDKPMKPVYTAEMHAKGELPQVGADCILIIDSDPRQARVTYIGKSLGVCSNIDGGAEYAFLLGKASFKPIIKTIKVNGFDVPAPMSEAPMIGDEYFTPQTGYEVFYCKNSWRGDKFDSRFLSRGLVHSTESAAIAHAKAMLGINPNA